jgi:Zn-finger nucleic acid-binding protein
VANCTNCGAPLPPNTIACEYCGSRNDTDLKGVHRYTTHELDETRTCPRCAIPLRTVDLQVNGKFLVERCDQCLGLFFDPGELEALLQATVTNVFTVNRKQLDSLNAARRAEDYTISYVKCPVCATVMSRVNYGTRSGIIVDKCPDHGIWLDGGELRQLFEWTKAGGALLEKERQEAKLKEAQREIGREGRTIGQQGTGSGYLEREADRGLFGERDPDLFDMLRAVARFFS